MLPVEAQEAVDKLLKAAFETDAEAGLVKTLRNADALAAEHLLPLDEDESELHQKLFVPRQNGN